VKLGHVTDEPSERDEPNVAPLIDIVFILLIFFVVTTTFDAEGENPPELQRAGWQAISDNFGRYVEADTGRGGA